MCYTFKFSYKFFIRFINEFSDQFVSVIADNLVTPPPKPNPCPALGLRARAGPGVVESPVIYTVKVMFFLSDVRCIHTPKIHFMSYILSFYQILILANYQ